MNEIRGSVSLPVDSEGFLRRECPFCEREFKWLPNDADATLEPAGYHCPYCDGRSEDGWWTRPQLKVVEAETAYVAEREVHSMFKGLERSSNEFVKISAGSAPSRPMSVRLTEPDDMRRIEFTCHPEEPLKVLDDWSQAVHCLLCGQIAA